VPKATIAPLKLQQNKDLYGPVTVQLHRALGSIRLPPGMPIQLKSIRPYRE
jgi:hypothetical protein